MTMFHHDRTDDEGDAHDEAANGNEGHVAGAFGSLGGLLTPQVVKDAESLMAKADATLDKANAVLDDVKLVADGLVKVLGLKK